MTRWSTAHRRISTATVAPRSAVYPISPRAWALSLSGPPVLHNDAAQWPGAQVRRWRDVHPDISQPRLDHHYLTMHLGGAKQVRRRGEGKCETVHVEPGALSIIPAGSIFEWSTLGPVDFAHVYCAPATLNRVGIQEFDRDGCGSSLEDRLGIRDPLLEAVFRTILDEIAAPNCSQRLYLDSLTHLLMLRLLRAYGGAPATPLRTRHAIAPARLQRVLDFIDANLASDVALADLAAVAVSSPFHFSRAFARVTGLPPYAYLLQRRVDRAKTLLVAGSRPLEVVAAECGFHSAAQMSRTFKRVAGLSPMKFRQAR